MTQMWKGIGITSAKGRYGGETWGSWQEWSQGGDMAHVGAWKLMSM